MKIENLANQILTKMPDNLSKLEQARYIYLELGKMVTFDEKYWFANTRTKNKIFKSHQRIIEFKQLPNRKIICVSLSKLYNNLIRQLGIEAETETIAQKRKDENPHVYSIVTIDEVKYKADLQRDLKYIQAKRRTRNFGKDMRLDGEDSISSEHLEKIDTKLGYLYDGDEFLDKLKNEMEKSRQAGEKIENRVKQILDRLGQCEDIKQMGYIEKVEYYKDAISQMLDKSESDRIRYIDMYLKRGEDKQYTQCVSVHQKDNKYSRFIYSEKTGTYLPIEDSKMMKLMNEGLKTVREQKIPGLLSKKNKTRE